MAQPAAPVRLYVSVTGRSGISIGDLTQSAFHLSVDGHDQPIETFAAGAEPGSVGLVIQGSLSTKDNSPAVGAAVKALVGALAPRAEVFAMGFNDKTTLYANWTTNPEAISRGLQRMEFRGGSAVLDGIHSAVAYMDRTAAQQHRVVVAITNGDDNASGKSLSDVISLAQRADIAVYSFVVKKNSVTDKKSRSQQEEITKKTGGRMFYAAKASEWEQQVPAAAGIMRSYYVIGFTPASAGSSVHRIRVTLPSNPDAVVSARESCFESAC
ncbi:MAG TPA: VWA domain-containing protein [Bryobacteraceae bacterium]|nr:VWA domain-containing protein [Bryobacteraceae bacterium]